MGARLLQFVRDGLANIASGRGTSVDKRSSNLWYFNQLTPDQVESAYRTNWLARKIIDIPAKDMTREGRAWQAKKDVIEALEAEEARLNLWPKLLRVLVLARLFGGGALIPSVGDTALDEPLNLEAVRKDGLRFIHVVNRYQLTHGSEITDPESEWFGQPEYFQITGRGGVNQAKLHPSRVIPFVGQKVPEGSQFTQTDSWFWGDSILQSINEAVQDATAAANGFAALVDEAAVDVIKIPDLMSQVGKQEYEDRLMQRLALAKMGQSTHRAKLLDGGEEWEQRQVTWTGIPEVMRAYYEVAAGAADIPLTRLLNISASGLGSNGDGEERDYHSKVMSDQGEILKPQLERVDELLIRSATGARADDIYFEFNSLEQPDEAKDADIEKKRAETLKIYGDTGMLSDEALAEIAKNAMIESGRWPGCEAAFEAHPEPEEEPDPADLQTAEQATAAAVENMRVKGAVNDAQAVALITDARPRSLYVSRKLLNGAALIKWAKQQGIPGPMAAGDIHVTVLYSKMPVDWLKMGSTWDQDQDGKLKVPPGGARIVERLGDKGAVVLLFNSSSLAWRHEEMVRNGASHDFDEFQPHITVSWSVPADFDLDAVEPYRGELLFGPEIFAEIDPEWAPPGSKKNLADYDPDQPRDPGGEEGGQWISVGGDVSGERFSRAAAKKGMSDSEAEVAAALDRHFAAISLLTDNERETLRYYASSTYDEINGDLRAGRKNDLGYQITALDSAIAKERTVSALTVYRGVGTSGSDADDLPIGSEISDAGYSSTSGDPNLAAKFASWANQNSNPTMNSAPLLLRIKVPKSANALHVHTSRTGLSNGEHEVLLPRGSKMRIMSAPKTETFTVYGEPVGISVVDVELVR